jgi:16S rRNA (cytosine1402-N4)-methyltransferase
MSAPHHIPVLLREVVALLAPKTGETYLDCTAGLGGHAAAIAPALTSMGTVILNDADPGNLAHAKVRIEALPNAPKVHAIHGNFAEIPWKLRDQSVDMLLADLGFASSQMDDAARGFSFMRDGPLDMRLDPSLPTSAADLVNTLPEAELLRILRDFGEEKAARTIARKLVQTRRELPITTTSHLAETVRSVVRPTGNGIHPATRTFQALRIAVNDELGSLDALLGAVRRAASGKSSLLKPGARVGIIAFHSLEDRPVKHCFADLIKDGLADDVSDGAVKPADDEVDDNPRSRSATLRVIRIVGGHQGGAGNAASR